MSTSIASPKAKEHIIWYVISGRETRHPNKIANQHEIKK